MFAKKAVFAVALALWSSVCLSGDAEVFHSPITGFQLTKPAGWYYLTAEQNIENIKAIKLNDEEFHAAIQKYATAPLVAMTKYPEPYDDVNPSFKVTFKPYGSFIGKTPEEIINLVFPQFQRIFRDVRLVQPPTEVSISGIKSGYARMNYTMEVPDGRTFPVTSELWIVPSGDYFFMIGAGTRPDERTGSREEIRNILETVRIERQDLP